VSIGTIEARELCRVFAASEARLLHAVDRVSLTIPAGSFVLVSGPSGSGKTTLLMLLGALDRPTSGQLWVDGQELTRCSEAERSRYRRRVGFVFQDFALLPRLSVRDNVTYPLIPRGIAWSRRQALATDWLTRFGLAERLDQVPEQLSGGERQRVAIARALAGEPALLLADEPTSNLDPAARQRVVEQFRTWHTPDRTIIVATHDAEWQSLATMHVHLEHGTLAGR
jgi:putative ABC transport system ATP-binding protein